MWPSCASYSGDNMMPASNLAAGRDESTSTRSPGEEKSVTHQLLEKPSAPQECFSFKSIFSNVNITTSFLLVCVFQEKVSLFPSFISACPCPYAGFSCTCDKQHAAFCYCLRPKIPSFTWWVSYTSVYYNYCYKLILLFLFVMDLLCFYFFFLLSCLLLNQLDLFILL